MPTFLLGVIHCPWRMQPAWDRIQWWEIRYRIFHRRRKIWLRKCFLSVDYYWDRDVRWKFRSFLWCTWGSWCRDSSSTWKTLALFWFARDFSMSGSSGNRRRSSCGPWAIGSTDGRFLSSTHFYQIQRQIAIAFSFIYQYLHLSAQVVSISNPDVALGIVFVLCNPGLAIWITTVLGSRNEKSKNLERWYLIIFGRPSIESDLECFDNVIFLYDVTYSPISLVVSGVNEIANFVQLAYRWLFFSLSHFKNICSF